MDGVFSGGKGVWRFAAVLFFLFLLGGCGSSEDGDAMVCPGDAGCPDAKRVTVKPLLSEFVGTYDLQGFKIRNETGSVDIDESDLDSWCGRLVVSSDGYILYEQTLEGSSGTYTWQILDLTKNAFQIREGQCEAWVDYLFTGSELILLWPEGPCMEDYSLTLRTAKISTSEVYPADNCPAPEDALDPEIEAFAGTYELLEFTYTDTLNGSMLTQDDAVSWSGRMVATSKGVMDFVLTMNDQEYESVWKILAVDSDTSEILLVNEASCEEWIDFQRDSEENVVALMWSGSDCTSGIAMTFRFAWVEGSNAAANGFVKSASANFLFDSNVSVSHEAVESAGRQLIE